MSRSRQLPLILWVVLWAVAFGESLRTFDRPMGLCPLEVSAAADPNAYPVVIGQRHWPGRIAEDVRSGDRLLRIAGEDVRGASGIDVFLRFARLARGSEVVPVVIERDGRTLELPVPANLAHHLRPWFVVSAIYMLVALLLLWRAPPSPMVNSLFRAFAATAILFGAWPDDYFSLLVGHLTLGLTCTLNLIAFQRFPHDDSPRGAWARAWPWLFVVLGPLHTSRFGGPFPAAVAEPLVVAGVILFFAMLLVTITGSYRSADPIGRRRLRWVLLAIYLASLPSMLSGMLTAIDPRWTMTYALNLVAVGLIPLGVLISIVRYNLLDIDRLLSSAASYNVLLVLALAGEPGARANARRGYGGTPRDRSEQRAGDGGGPARADRLARAALSAAAPRARVLPGALGSGPRRPAPRLRALALRQAVRADRAPGRGSRAAPAPRTLRDLWAHAARLRAVLRAGARCATRVRSRGHVGALCSPAGTTR